MNIFVFIKCDFLFSYKVFKIIVFIYLGCYRLLIFEKIWLVEMILLLNLVLSVVYCRKCKEVEFCGL